MLDPEFDIGIYLIFHIFLAHRPACWTRLTTKKSCWLWSSTLWSVPLRTQGFPTPRNTWRCWARTCDRPISPTPTSRRFSGFTFTRVLKPKCGPFTAWPRPTADSAHKRDGQRDLANHSRVRTDGLSTDWSIFFCLSQIWVRTPQSSRARRACFQNHHQNYLIKTCKLEDLLQQLTNIRFYIGMGGL